MANFEIHLHNTENSRCGGEGESPPVFPPTTSTTPAQPGQLIKPMHAFRLVQSKMGIYVSVASFCDVRVSTLSALSLLYRYSSSRDLVVRSRDKLAPRLGVRAVVHRYISRLTLTSGGLVPST